MPGLRSMAFTLGRGCWQKARVRSVQLKTTYPLPSMAATFTDSSFQKFLMGFNPHPDGSFDQISVSVGDASVLIKGRIIGNIIEADVTNETFEHHWHLKKD